MSLLIAITLLLSLSAQLTFGGRDQAAESTSANRRRLFIEPHLCKETLLALPQVEVPRVLASCTKFLNNRERQHILVTGGAGFVGSHLVDELMLEGHEVTVLDNFHTGRQRNIEHWLGHENFKLIERDIINGDRDGKYEQIYHLASPASPVHYMADPIKTIKTITLGTMRMLNLAHNLGIRIVLASTSEIYGDPLEHPQAESYWGNVNPVGPRACYDESKRLSETLAIAFRDQHNVSVGIARIFNTYGPRMHPNDGRVVSNFVSQSIGNKPMTVYGMGNQTRSFQYVSDLVRGLKLLMASKLTSPVNLGNPDEITINSLAATIKQAVRNSTSEIIFHELPRDDPSRRRPDIRKAMKLLDWRPSVTLLQGLEKTIEYFAHELNHAR